MPAQRTSPPEMIDAFLTGQGFEQPTSDPPPPLMDLDMAIKLLTECFVRIIAREAVRGVEPTPTTAQLKAINHLGAWLARDPQGPLDPRRSVILYGDVGRGKSAMAEAFQLASSIYGKSSTGGGKSLTLLDKDRVFKYISLEKATREVGRTQKLTPMEPLESDHYVLDELRQEDLTVVLYAQRHQVLSDVLYARHEAWKMHQRLTLITTNVPPKILLEMIRNPASHDLDGLRADERLADRMEQEYQHLALGGKNHRKV